MVNIKCHVPKKIRLRLPCLAALAATFLGLTTPALNAEAGSIILQSTTSTDNSGLYNYLLPRYANSSGTTVHVVAVGTGQALENARNCDGDIVIAHARQLELDFVANGYGTERHDLMYNDFVVIGPKSDPASVAGSGSIDQAMQKIVTRGGNFASRGDGSGTNRAERRLWQTAGFTPDSKTNEWYLETGMGMGATLNFAVQANAYTISDRATWLAFGNKSNHTILFDGDPALFNQYGVIPVSPEKCPTIRHDEARAFRDWLVSAEGQTAIADFQKHGSQLFFPNAR